MPANAGTAVWRFAVGASALASALVMAGASPERAPYLDGAPPGFSGGFGEDSCTACHFEADLNQPPGSVALLGVPAAYTPNTSYDVTVALTRPGMALAGFLLTARFEDGTQAGALTPQPGAEARIGVTTDPESRVEYAHQRESGSRPSGQGATRWTVRWTAPATGTAAVLFHVAANAADGDGSASGDYVYTAAAASLPQ